MSPCRYLVLPGGGSWISVFVGILEAAEDRGILVRQRLEGIAGASIGAFLALLLAIGWNLQNIREFLCQVTMDLVFCPRLKNFTEGLGLDDRQSIRRILRAVLGKTIGKEDPTFAEFRERTRERGYDLELVLWGTDLRNGEAVAFSAESHPNMSVATAVEISVSLPVMFQPVEHEGRLWIDGALLVPVPLPSRWKAWDSLILRWDYDHGTPLPTQPSYPAYMLRMFQVVMKALASRTVDDWGLRWSPFCCVLGDEFLDRNRTFAIDVGETMEQRRNTIEFSKRAADDYWRTRLRFLRAVRSLQRAFRERRPHLKEP